MSATKARVQIYLTYEGRLAKPTEAITLVAQCPPG
jgi:hypothetical protein